MILVESSAIKIEWVKSKMNFESVLKKIEAAYQLSLKILFLLYTVNWGVKVQFETP